LANHINNSLTKLSFCGGSTTQSDDSISISDDDDCWRFFDGLMEEQHIQHGDDPSRSPRTEVPPLSETSLLFGRPGVR
jgi:hypothetical protein